MRLAEMKEDSRKDERETKTEERQAPQPVQAPWPAETQNAASSPIKEEDVMGPTLQEKVYNNEEKIKMLMDKLEQQAAQRPESEVQPPVVEEPPHPQLEDKLRQLREDIAKNYEDKMTRGFEEIQEIKKDMENKQEIYET